MDYHIISQGKTTIPGVNDGEELELTDVRFEIFRKNWLQCEFQILKAKTRCKYDSTLVNYFIDCKSTMNRRR